MRKWAGLKGKGRGSYGAGLRPEVGGVMGKGAGLWLKEEVIIDGKGGATAGSGRGYLERGGVIAKGGGVNKRTGRGYGRKWVGL